MYSAAMITKCLKIKGPPGVSFGELNSGGSFYIYSPKLTGVGCVSTRPDIKEGSSLYPEPLHGWAARF